jgi:hypothetical protein
MDSQVVAYDLRAAAVLQEKYLVRRDPGHCFTNCER